MVRASFKATSGEFEYNSFGRIACDALVFCVFGTVVENKSMPQFSADSISEWRNVVQVPRSSREYQVQFDYIKAVASQWQSKYSTRLVIVNMYRVYRDMNQPWVQDEDSRHLHAEPNSIESTLRLFHGTTWTAAKAIVHDGYRLPHGAGMFGKGIYFADTPHKSWQYTKSNGLILMNRVELGSTKIKRTANSDESGW